MYCCFFYRGIQSIKCQIIFVVLLFFSGRIERHHQLTKTGDFDHQDVGGGDIYSMMEPVGRGAAGGEGLEEHDEDPCAKVLQRYSLHAYDFI